MKKAISLILLLTFLLSLCACGKTNDTPAPDTTAPDGEIDTAPETDETTESRPETILFTDSCGREVEIPTDISRIAPSGSVATMFLAAVAPEILCCTGSDISEDQQQYLDERVAALPVTGQLYGGKSTLNMETLLGAEPQIIIDMGDMKKDIAEGLDGLQAQVGIPCIFIESDLDSMAEAFRTLGRLINGKAERCDALAAYVEETLALAKDNLAKIPEDERLSVMYTSGSDGLGTNAKGSSQAQVLELVGAKNAIEVEDVTSKGGGNIINMEQLFVFNPEVILFTADSIYDTVGEDASWMRLDAVQESRYYEIPASPYNWLGNPPSMNMLLGVRWLGNLLYPEVYDLDMVIETQRVYKLLWDYDMSTAEAEEILSRSTGR